MVATRLFLLAASAAAYVAAQTPAADPSTGCTAKSFSIPSWLIQDLRYTGGNVSFHLTNRANNYTADLACAVTTQGWNECAPRGRLWSNDTLQTAVQPTGSGLVTVLVNQTWTCSDRGKP